MKPRKGSLRAIGLYFVAKFALSFIVLLFVVQFLLGGIKIVDGRLTLGYIEEHRQKVEELQNEQQERIDSLNRAFGSGN